MSLSWLKKKPLRIGLGAKRILVSGTREVQLQAVELQADDWRGAMPALAEILKAHRGAEASVVVADQFTRYALLPHNDAVRSPAQWLALARHRFSALHGAIAAEWEVKVSETAPLGARLACAVDRELIEQLAGKFVAAGVKLISVQPFLVA
ncbi:MAG TPA: hypothetical protein VFR83_08970, partial [Burkholderiales bacterium]|nr:hypothetical protein [Burkholderiales bacterium]